MTFQLPPLPYAMTELEPHISKETLEYHYGKHHQAYVNNLNQLLIDKPQATDTLENIIMHSEGALFNNAAQVWNHSFYWHCLSPQGGGEPKNHVRLIAAIHQAFGSFQEFKELFTKTAIGTFGSGWAWLVKDKNQQLSVTSTSNADTPMRHAQHALLTCDVWEHAYYIDYRNARPSYLEHFWQLVNWDFVAQNLEK